jgi:micrococcal nuclease
MVFTAGCVATTKTPLDQVPLNSMQESKDTLITTPTVKGSPKSVESAKPVKSNSDKNFIEAKIERVVDGDTMKILVSGTKKTETIRLLLVDTPETVDPDIPEPQPFGPEASKFAKDTLTGKNIKIEIDVSERDKYGRLLCYLYIGDKMFNKMLLEKGLARVAYVYPPNVKYVDQFRAIQKKAQHDGIGIWSIENYAKDDGFHTNLVMPAVKSQSQTSKTYSKTTPKTATTQQSNTPIYYKNCTQAKNAGVTPIKKGDPGYESNLDGDGDGIACEK